MSRSASISTVAALALSATCGTGLPASADVADFYRGRPITIVVAGGAGASLGLYCRLVTTHWSKHVPGNPKFICQFKPGAGGTKAAAYMYNAAPKDGTVIGEILSPSVLAPVLPVPRPVSPRNKSVSPIQNAQRTARVG